MAIFHSFFNMYMLNSSRNTYRLNSRIQNSKNQDYGPLRGPKRIEDNSMVNKVDQNREMEFKKVDPNKVALNSTNPQNNFKKERRSTKSILGSTPLAPKGPYDLWSIKDAGMAPNKGENRKLPVRTNFSRAVEKIGLIPRSIIRTSDRFRKQLFPGTETLLLQEFRISRYQILVSLKCLLALIFIPLTVHFLTKNLILTPLIEYLWNNNKNDIFLNSTQQEQALSELQDFENEIYFELLVAPNTADIIKDETEGVMDSTTRLTPMASKKPKGGDSKRIPTKTQNEINGSYGAKNVVPINREDVEALISKRGQRPFNEEKKIDLSYVSPQRQERSYLDQNKVLSQKQEFQEKTVALAIKYNQQSIDSLIRLTSDFITVLTLIGVILVMKAEIIILKSFLIETVYSFNDTTKSFLIIFITDLLVGFHSSPGWELFFQSILNRFGLPFTETSILLTVAIVPVFLDTLFKYWIFRYLNKISPTTVATLNAMRE